MGSCISFEKTHINFPTLSVTKSKSFDTLPALERMEKNLTTTLNALKPPTPSELVPAPPKFQFKYPWRQIRPAEITEKAHHPAKKDPKSKCADHRDPFARISVKTPASKRQESVEDPHHQMEIAAKDAEDKGNGCKKADEMFRKGKKINAFDSISGKEECREAKEDACEQEEQTCKKNKPAETICKVNPCEMSPCQNVQSPPAPPPCTRKGGNLKGGEIACSRAGDIKRVDISCPKCPSEDGCQKAPKPPCPPGDFSHRP